MHTFLSTEEKKGGKCVCHCVFTRFSSIPKLTATESHPPGTAVTFTSLSGQSLCKFIPHHKLYTLKECNLLSLYLTPSHLSITRILWDTTDTVAGTAHQPFLKSVKRCTKGYWFIYKILVWKARADQGAEQPVEHKTTNKRLTSQTENTFLGL